MKQFYLIVHNLRSLHNVGSLFRTADAFKINKIYLCGYSPTPPRDQISKVALGAEKWVDWEKYTQASSLIKKLKKNKIKIYALETGKKTKNILHFKPRFPCALIIGNEIRGLPKTILNLADQIIFIPMLGKKTSLNVSVAAGVALYEFNRHRY